MEELIRQAILHIDIFDLHVAEGHYDIIGPDGMIILPQTWEFAVKPGDEFTLLMWPLHKQGLSKTPRHKHKQKKIKHYTRFPFYQASRR